MAKYRNIDTGETYTLEELRESYEMYKDEMDEKCENFEEYLDHFLDLGRQGIAGFEEV